MHLSRKPSALGLGWKYRRAFSRTPLLFNAWIAAAHGDERVQSVDVSVGGRLQRIECDLAAVGAGLVANLELGQLLGCDCDGDAIRVDALQQTVSSGVFAAGECTGVKGDAAAIIEGEIAGRAVAGDRNGALSSRLQRQRRAGRAFATALGDAFAVRDALRHLATADTVICRCEDVRYGAVDPSWTQRQAKLWTRVGMGECQGAVCGPLCDALFGWQRNSPRPPLGSPQCATWAAALRDQPVEDPARATDSSR